MVDRALISLEDAKNRLRETFIKYGYILELLRETFTKHDFLSELFPRIDEFYIRFRALHAQLKKDDSLEIRIMGAHDVEDGCFEKRPVIEVYLVPEKGKEKKVVRFDCEKYTGEELLYN